MYVVVAKWVAREGEEAAIEQILRENAAESRREPGCRTFAVSRSTEEPRTYVLYEEYADEDAFQAHRTSPHFKRYVLDDAVANNRLEGRSATFYESID
jgi:quinol monooxygenase YgiN